MEKDIEEIKIATKDKVRGFYTLLTNDSVICLPNNEYIVPKHALSELAKEGIKFKVNKKK